MTKLATAAAAVPVLLRDICGLAGAAAIVRGVWLVSEPGAWIAAGALLLAAAAIWARR